MSVDAFIFALALAGVFGWFFMNPIADVIDDHVGSELLATAVCFVVMGCFGFVALVAGALIL